MAGVQGDPVRVQSSQIQIGSQAAGTAQSALRKVGSPAEAGPPRGVKVQDLQALEGRIETIGRLKSAYNWLRGIATSERQRVDTDNRATVAEFAQKTGGKPLTAAMLGKLIGYSQTDSGKLHTPKGDLLGRGEALRKKMGDAFPPDLQKHLDALKAMPDYTYSDGVHLPGYRQTLIDAELAFSRVETQDLREWHGDLQQELDDAVTQLQIDKKSDAYKNVAGQLKKFDELVDKDPGKAEKLLKNVQKMIRQLPFDAVGSAIDSKDLAQLEKFYNTCSALYNKLDKEFNPHRADASRLTVPKDAQEALEKANRGGATGSKKQELSCEDGLKGMSATPQNKIEFGNRYQSQVFSTRESAQVAMKNIVHNLEVAQEKIHSLKKSDLNAVQGRLRGIAENLKGQDTLKKNALRILDQAFESLQAGRFEHAIRLIGQADGMLPKP